MKQYEAVEHAMREAGGYATLGSLYQNALKVPNVVWGTLTPFASIRRIVQTHRELFFRIKPGLWGLTAHRKAILTALALPPKPSSPVSGAFDHTYYQGLLVEIGNLKHYKTAVPNQDKNRLFLQQRLADVVTATGSYDFTYEQMLKRARTVDVVWYNSRQFPDSFFEVEHSTAIEHSLFKFLDFQDFQVKFYIVANRARKAEYGNILARSVLESIRTKVKFMDYDAVSDWHSKLWQSVTAEQRATGPAHSVRV